MTFAEPLVEGKAYIVSSINKNASESISAGESFSLVPQIIVATGSENYVGSVTKFTGCYGGKRYENGSETGTCLTGVVNSLNSTSTTDALSAYQGKILNDKLENEINAQRKNLINCTWEPETNGGISFSRNPDGTYVLNGTLNYEYADGLLIDNLSLKLEKDARWVAIPEGVNGLQVNLYTVEDGTSRHWESGSIVPAGKTVNEIYVWIKGSNVVLDNIIVKPMLTYDLSATYDDFLPYSSEIPQYHLTSDRQDFLNIPYTVCWGEWYGSRVSNAPNGHDGRYFKFGDTIIAIDGWDPKNKYIRMYWGSWRDWISF